MDFLMPKLSDTMEEGTVLQWFKDDGADVAKGEPIVEIESDKANMTVEAPESGVLRIVAQVGDSLPIGAPIATIGDGAAAAAEPAAAPESAAPPVSAPPTASEVPPVPEPAAAEVGGDETTGIPTTDDGTGESIGMDIRPPEAYPGAVDDGAPDVVVPPVPVPSAAPSPPGEEVRASPLARRLAQELGVDLRSVRGTGPAGRIVREDVESAVAGAPATAAGPTPAAAGPPTPTPPAEAPARTLPGERTPLTRLQRTVARRMAESKPGTPHFYLQRDIEATSLLALRKELVAASPEGQGPSVNDLIVRAVAMASAERPDTIRQFNGDALVSPSGVHVGIAVAVPAGLMVPVVRDADTKRVGQIAAEVRSLAARCRDGSITPPELEGSVITVSNLGMFGIDRFLAVINPPEAAILAVGRAAPTPVVKDGQVVPGNVITLTLSVDHRALYGAEAATFLGRIAELLELPGSLVL
jgi:pyruvate dehydrogenase E2 component (dihydrolipoamide acetyltransferase)